MWKTTIGKEVLMTQETWAQRIEALIAKAQSTEFPEEAEALFAKAQALMTKHSIDEAMLRKSERRDDEVVTEWFTITKPYTNAKAELLWRVSKRNNVVTLLHGNVTEGQFSMTGYKGDIEATQTLYTNLLLHGTNEMLKTPQPISENTKSWRNSFLLAYAKRISFRLYDMEQAAITEAKEEHGAEAVGLVLVDRKKAVDHKVQCTWGKIGSGHNTGGASSSAGASAGRSAADRANLGNKQIGGMSRQIGAGN